MTSGRDIIAECETYWRAPAGSASVSAQHMKMEVRLARRMAAHRIRAELGYSWRRIGVLLGVSHVAAFKAARRWAP